MKFFGKMSLAAIAVSSLFCSVNGAVIEASDKNIDELLSSGIPTVLDIYASWCGHCKRLSPVLDELASLFEHAKDKVQFVKIDGDIHRKTSKKWGIQYYPTVKFIDGKSTTDKDIVNNAVDVEMRELEQLEEFVVKNVPGLKAKKAPVAPSDVVLIKDEKSFEEALSKVGPNGGLFAAFTSQNCGHCKNMKPAFEELGHVYARDSNVVIANVDCSEPAARDLAAKYEIRGFPTMKYFSGEKLQAAAGQEDFEPELYTGGRTVEDFTQFLTEKGVGQRNADGSLVQQAGRIAALDDLISQGINIEEVKEKAQSLVDASYPTVKYYLHYADRIVSKGQDYVAKELARLNKLVQAKNLVPDKKDELQWKINVLSAFLSEEKPKHEDL